jgi:hypothetical protein
MWREAQGGCELEKDLSTVSRGGLRSSTRRRRRKATEWIDQSRPVLGSDNIGFGQSKRAEKEIVADLFVIVIVIDGPSCVSSKSSQDEQSITWQLLRGQGGP